MNRLASISNWRNVRLRDVVEQYPTLEQRRALANAQQVSFLPMEAIGEQGELDLSIVRDKELVQMGYTLFFEGDVLVAKITPCFENGKGAVAANLLNGVGFGTTELHVLRPSAGVDPRFLYYITASQPFRAMGEANMTGAAGQKRVPTEFVYNFRISLPPLLTQRAIAAYLDRETAKIDAMIDAKQRLLALLAEKRRALITHAVTRGLDPAVPMRDSGVPWIGEVPAHWEVMNIKYIAQVGNGSTPRRDYKPYWEDGDFPWLTSTVVNQDIVETSFDFVTEFALRECHLPIVEPNSVLVAITGEGKTRGKAAILPYQATINQHMAYISPQAHLLNHEFLQRYLVGSYEILRMISEGTGSTKGALTCEQIRDYPTPLPPISEQITITEKIKATIQELDCLSDTTQKSIELLHERRGALITAAVSGNIGITE